jgi:hypothetical protein
VTPNGSDARDRYGARRNAGVQGGTESSNLLCSSGESANPRSLAMPVLPHGGRKSTRAQDRSPVISKPDGFRQSQQFDGSTIGLPPCEGGTADRKRSRCYMAWLSTCCSRTQTASGPPLG